MYESLRLRSLDSARGIAAFLVLIYHIKIVTSSDEFMFNAVWNYPIFGIFFELGEISVFFFMLLSGYVLAQVVCYSKATKMRLIGWRIFRLSSIYYLSLVIAFLVVQLGQEYSYGIRPSDITHAYLFSNADVFSGVNAPLWSLSIEIIFSLLVFGLPKSFVFTKRSRHLAVIVLFLFLCYFPEQWGLIALFRCFAFFLLGVMIFNQRENLIKLKLNGWSLIPLFFAHLTLLDFDRRWGYFFLPLTLPLLLIFLLQPKSKFLNSVFVTRVGSLSFSLYVTHWPVILVLQTFEPLELGNANIKVVVMVLICFLSAIIFHKLIDLPIQKISKSILRSSDHV